MRTEASGFWLLHAALCLSRPPKRQRRSGPQRLPQLAANTSDQLPVAVPVTGTTLTGLPPPKVGPVGTNRVHHHNHHTPPHKTDPPSICISSEHPSIGHRRRQHLTFHADDSLFRSRPQLIINSLCCIRHSASNLSSAPPNLPASAVRASLHHQTHEAH